MKVKSFFGNSIKEALDKARRELGPDAAIVASRQLRAEEGGGCEVVCGMDEALTPSRGSATAEGTPGPGRGFGQGEAARREAQVRPAPTPPLAPVQPTAEGRTRRGVTRIRKHIEALVHPAGDEFGSDKVRAELTAAGFAADLTDDIVAGVRQRQRQGAERASALRDELATRLSFSPQLGIAGAERRIIAFVGPPGAGKTTTLVKLAVRYGLKARKPMHIISMDSWRIGGTDALRSYASGMGVTFEALETAESLRQSLEEHAGKGLILIDTAGLAPAEMKAAAPLAALLSTHSEADVQLVLPAHAAPSAMGSIVQRFRPFLPSKLVITGMDCAESRLPVAALALSTDKPVSFIGTGQLIPEDIEEANADRLLGPGLAEEKKTATSAA